MSRKGTKKPTKTYERPGLSEEEIEEIREVCSWCRGPLECDGSCLLSLVRFFLRRRSISSTQMARALSTRRSVPLQVLIERLREHGANVCRNFLVSWNFW